MADIGNPRHTCPEPLFLMGSSGAWRRTSGHGGGLDGLETVAACMRDSTTAHHNEYNEGMCLLELISYAKIGERKRVEYRVQALGFEN